MNKYPQSHVLLLWVSFWEAVDTMKWALAIGKQVTGAWLWKFCLVPSPLFALYFLFIIR